ncbi:hypothetical protein [Microbacterium sulfonylureivorans]|uniref:hypothetical protein n=1 Tax=Microbacterium sulfonylureivorans TaxID=2486854 RepID=UPI000FD92D5F|nr:hypothetical protein [Microbacterium sulfonylureivorans]
MAIDDIDESFNVRVRDSFNSTSANTANITADLQNVGNTDDSTNDSGNTAVDLDGSFNEDSHDMDLDTDVDVEDSFNDESDNSTDDHTDNSTDDSYNDNSDNSVDDSYNSWTDASTDDHSTNAGARTYNAGMGDVSLAGAAGGGGGALHVSSHNTVVDQSVNGNVAAFGGVGLVSKSDAVVASGDGAMAAGDDIDIHQSLDESTTILGGDDVNVGNTTSISNVLHSHNSATDNSTSTDNSWDVDIDGSFNDDSDSYTATNSFNEELTSINESDWDVDANVIWDSEDSVVVDDVDVDLDLPG